MIRTRSDILGAVQRVCGTACGEAMVLHRSGTRLLGLFKSVAPPGPAGWIVRVVSVHGKEWLWAVLAEIRVDKDPRVVQVSNVPWKEWDGTPGQTKYDMHTGDEPCDNFRKFQEALAPEDRKAMALQTLIPVARLPRFLEERDGLKRTKVTIYNWINDGIKQRDGEPYRLRTIMRNGRMHTTEDWLQEFLYAGNKR